MCLEKDCSNTSPSNFAPPLFFFFSSVGEVPSVLASRAFGQVPVLCGGSNGRVQHAPVHPQRVQSHRCPGMLVSPCASITLCEFTLVCLCGEEGWRGGGELIGIFHKYNQPTQIPPNFIFFYTNADSLAVRKKILAVISR